MPGNADSAPGDTSQLDPGQHRGSSNRLAVLLFTDIVGSTAMKSVLGNSAYIRLLTRHNEIFEAALAEFPPSSIIKHTGDGYFASFASASDAVRFALLFQSRMSHEPWQPRPLSARVGIHLGEVAQLDMAGQSDLVGLSADIAARLMSLATGGQILLTAGVFNEARQHVGDNPACPQSPLRWVAHGPYLFKGAEEPLDVFEVGAVGQSPLAAPADMEKASRVAPHDLEPLLGWRPAIGQAIPSRPGWMLTQKLGEGGFGEVWLGQDGDPAQRRVFKFCFNPERIRSLKREMTLFRLLRHSLGDRPDIAQLCQIKLDEPPFFLESEYTEGGNLADFAAKRGGITTFPKDQRIQLVMRTAEAIAAAHSVGILHKDIKPSNILIHVQADGELLPRISDFGIGILTQMPAGGDVTVTGFTELTDNDSSRTGTRMYAPPEIQINKPFTTAGDVYALGVLLFQMVVGDLARPLGQGWERSIECPVLRQDIADAVEGDPARRLSSAAELAQRLRTLDARRRRLADNQMQAARLQRRRRVRWIALAGGSIAAVILIAIAIQSFLHARKLDGLNQQLRDERDRVSAANVLAETRYRQARQTVEDLLTGISEDVLLNEPGMQPLRRKLLEAAAKYFEQFVRQRGDDPAVLRDMAQAYVRLGDITAMIGSKADAMRQYEAAAKIHETLVERLADAESRSALAGSYYRMGGVQWEMAKADEALRLHKRTLEIRRALVAQRPDVPRYRSELSASLMAVGATEEALKIRRKLVEENPDVTQFQLDLANTCTEIGRGLFRVGKDDEALGFYREAMKIQEPLAAANPGAIQLQRGLCDSYEVIAARSKQHAENAEAKQLYDKALKIRRRLAEENPAVGQIQNDLGNVLCKMSRFQSAEQALLSCRQALQIREKLVAANPTSVIFRLYVAEAHTLIGDIHFQGGRLKEAMESFLEATGVFKILVDEHPGMIWRTEAEPSVGLGQVYLAMGRSEDALTQYQRAATVLERLLAQEPASIVVRVRLLTTNFGIATLELKHDVKAARKAAERAVAIADSLLKDNGGAPAFRAFAATAYRCLGMVELIERRPKPAIAAAKTGAEVDPADPKLRALLAHGYLYDGQIENARAIYREARSEKPQPKTVLQLFQKLVDSSPEPKEPDAEPSLAEVVLADFQLLRQIGLEHPEMVKIEAELRSTTRPSTRPGAAK